MSSPPRLLSLLHDRQFARVWLFGLASGIARWLEMLVLGIYAYETTGSPFLVALLVILRMAPLPLFGSFVGVAADRFDPVRMLTVSATMITAISAVVAALFYNDMIEYWHVAVATAFSGLMWTTDLPLRRRILGEIAGPGRLSQAMGLDAATNNATRMLGPLIGGTLYQFVGGTGAYALSTVLYGLCIFLALTLSWRTMQAAEQAVKPTVLSDMKEAFRYAFTNRDVRSILSVTIVFNIWGFPFVSMVPVIGREELALSSFWVGILSAMEGGGAFFGAILIAIFAQALWFRRIYYYGALCHLILIFIAGWAQNVFAVFSLFFLIGIASACFGAMQATLIYAVAPENMRGRLYGLLVICIGTGLIGFTNIGLMAELFGAPNAMKIIAAEGLVPLLLIGWFWRELKN